MSDTEKAVLTAARRYWQVTNARDAGMARHNDEVAAYNELMDAIQDYAQEPVFNDEPAAG